MSEEQTTRGHRKLRIGEVISDKMEKTITVRVRRRIRHPKFKKIITVFSKCYVHDEKSLAKVGDQVRIQETRPQSKNKCWRLVEITHQAEV
jgi:small subunit ribosomal protein S17